MQCVCCDGTECGQPTTYDTDAWNAFYTETCACCSVCDEDGDGYCDNIQDVEGNLIECTDCNEDDPSEDPADIGALCDCSNNQWDCGGECGGNHIFDCMGTCV
jgi:hypothetical protein